MSIKKIILKTLYCLTNTVAFWYLVCLVHWTLKKTYFKWKCKNEYNVLMGNKRVREYGCWQKSICLVTNIMLYHGWGLNIVNILGELFDYSDSRLSQTHSRSAIRGGFFISSQHRQSNITTTSMTLLYLNL